MANPDVFQVSDHDFKKEVLESELVCIVDFWAEWCTPCKMIAPVVEQIARQYSGKVKVCKVNVDQAPQVAADYGIMSIPTLGVFSSGEMVDKSIGVVPISDIEDKIEKYID